MAQQIQIEVVEVVRVVDDEDIRFYAPSGRPNQVVVLHESPFDVEATRMLEEDINNPVADEIRALLPVLDFGS